RAGTVTNDNGSFILRVPANKKISVVFTSLGFKNDTIELLLNDGQRYEYNTTLKIDEIQLIQVEIEDKMIREAAGTIKLDMQSVQRIPTPMGGIEGALVTQGLGVSSTNEMSSTYSVRGG